MSLRRRAGSTGRNESLLCLRRSGFQTFNVFNNHHWYLERVDIVSHRLCTPVYRETLIYY